MSLSDNRIRETIDTLNSHIVGGAAYADELIRTLESHGSHCKEWIAFESFPDSGRTQIVRVLCRNGDLLEVDLDLDDSSATTIEPIGKRRYAKRSGQILLAAAREALTSSHCAG